MGNRVKNQHFVPQFYLKKFADTNERLFVYDKKTDKSFANNIKNVAHESYFYDIPKEWTEPGADLQAFEKALSEIEGIHAKILARTLDFQPGDRLDHDTAFGLGHMLLTQHSRTRASRNAAHELQMKFGQELVDDLMERNFPEEHKKFTPKYVMDEKASAIMMAQKILDGEGMQKAINSLLGRYWTIWFNRTERLFITSDHPVSMAATSNAADRYGVAPCVPFGVEVAFPLSPRCVLAVGDPPPILRPNAEILFADIDRIDLYNKMQVYSSNRHIFGSVNDFEFARKVCSDDPTLREEDQDRVKIASLRETDKSTTMTWMQPRHLRLNSP